MAHPNFAPKSTPSRRPIPKPQYLPHPWTRLTYDAKRHQDAIRHFSTFFHNWPTHVRTCTYGPTDRPRENLPTIGRCATIAMRPNNNNYSIIIIITIMTIRIPSATHNIVHILLFVSVMLHFAKQTVTCASRSSCSDLQSFYRHNSKCYFGVCLSAQNEHATF